MPPSASIAKPSAAELAETRVLLALAARGGAGGWVLRGEVNKRLGRLPRTAREGAIARLIAEGAIEVGTRGRRSVRYRLTDRGIRRALDLDLAPRARVSGQEVTALLGLLRAEFARVARGAGAGAEAVGDRTASPAVAVPSTDPATHPETLRTLILREAEAIDRAEGAGGLVPIHRLRERLADRLSDEQLDGLLYDLARSGRASLNKVTDWSELTEAERRGSLHHPVKGLLFYLTLGGGLRL